MSVGVQTYCQYGHSTATQRSTAPVNAINPGLTPRVPNPVQGTRYAYPTPNLTIVSPLARMRTLSPAQAGSTITLPQEPPQRSTKITKLRQRASEVTATYRTYLTHMILSKNIQTLCMSFTLKKVRSQAPHYNSYTSKYVAIALGL